MIRWRMRSGLAAFILAALLPASVSYAQTAAPFVVDTNPAHRAIAAGSIHSLAIKPDGTVWAWGANDYGALGDGTTTYRSAPVQVSGVTNAIAVASGYLHSLALKSDGTVWAWGLNFVGELGDGTTTDRSTPVQVSGLTGVIAISAGQQHSLALKSDGAVWAWGNDVYGSLGDGTNTNSNTPVQVSGLTNVIAVASGVFHSLALKSDGTVWAWGWNPYGQLGDGTNTDRNIPVQVSGLNNVIAIAGGFYHSLALESDGTFWAWGTDFLGELGDGNYLDRNIPVPVSGITNVIAIAGGGFHSLGLKSDGTVWAWGQNSYGQLGAVSTDTCSSDISYPCQRTPILVSGLTNGIAIAGGYYYSLALESDGTLWAWGDNRFGQLGDGTYTNRPTPVQVGLSVGVVANAGPDKTLIVGEPGTFDGSASSDLGGTIVSYAWDFGDGGTGSGVAATHAYSAAGTFTVTLTVTDDLGTVGSDTAMVTVVTVAQAIGQLEGVVVGFHLQQGTAKALNAKLQNAQAALTAPHTGNLASACGLLGSFVNSVMAQAGKALTVDQANQLIAAINQIRTSLGCP